MKAVGVSLVIATSSLMANTAVAAQKIGYVGTAYVLQKMPQREAILAKLKKDLKDDRAELEKISAEIKTKAESKYSKGEGSSPPTPPSGQGRQEKANEKGNR